MEKTFTCKYCNKLHNSNQSRNGHQIQCIFNPNLRTIKERRKIAIKNSPNHKISKKILLVKICKKCGKEYNVYITEWANLKGSYTKYCSRSCANSRKHSLNTKKKIKDSICTNYNHCKVSYSNCILCGKIMIVKNGYLKKTCSQECYIKALKDRSERGLSTGGSWIARNLTSYPLKFFMEVLNNNNILYIHEYKVLKRLIDMNLKHCYFLDFYLVKYNIDLEIDGSQHKLDIQIEKDKIRDSLLSKKYKVYRILWNEVNSKEGKQIMKNKIEEFLTFINTL